MTQLAEPRTIRWTKDEFYRLVEQGYFQDRRVELIDGEIVVMPAQKNFHAVAIELTAQALRQAFGPTHWVRVQNSLDLSPFSVLDPDLAVVPGQPRDYPTADNPSSALLVVEVSDTTLAYDRGKKASIYAISAIADYWIVNLVNRQLEVHRDPVPDPSLPLGHRYGKRVILDLGDEVSPLVLPHVRIRVSDLLP